MSFDSNWDVNNYWGEHESDDQWQLRKEFLLKWKDHYPEERLVSLAQVFTNMEFMGCRYPSETMQEVARLSADLAQHYRNSRKSKLKRTFVSASDAAGDRAKGVKREGGVIRKPRRKKNAKIEFISQGVIPQGQSDTTEIIVLSDEENDEKSDKRLTEQIRETDEKMPDEQEMESIITIDDPIEVESVSISSCVNGISPQPLEANSLETISIEDTNKQPTTNDVPNKYSNFQGIDYMDDLTKCNCLDPRDFNESMYNTEFGKLVLVIRPWADMIANLTSTCLYSKLELQQGYRQDCFTIMVNKKIVSSVKDTRMVARQKASIEAWEKLRRIAVTLVLKEQWVTQGNGRISVTDMSDKKSEFGEPIEDSVAVKMMKLMGWKGGGLGPDNQGISEPIKPILRMVRRAGLGHASNDMNQLKRAGMALMRRRGIGLDADLVFASDFNQKERAILHQCANQSGLTSKSYGKGDERFLVVTNKLKPFSLVRAIMGRGGETAKYRVFLPATMPRT